MVSIGDVCELIGGSTPSKRIEAYWQNGTVKWISSKHIDDRGRITGYELITKQAVDESSTRIAPSGSTIIITRVSVGKYAIADDDYAVNQDLTALIAKDTAALEPRYLRILAPRIASVVEQRAEGSGVRGVTRAALSEIMIPLPPIEVQREIVAEIEAEEALVQANRDLIARFEKKIQSTLARVWGGGNP